MCTVGAVFVPGQGVVVFKQCDLASPATFSVPGVEDGAVLLFERSGAPGPYAGANAHGVMLVAADAYMASEDAEELMSRASPDTMAAYAHVLRHAHNAAHAAELLGQFYEENDALDIALLADSDEAWLLESKPGEAVASTRVDEGYLVATNHFRMLPGAVEWEDNNSTYLRLMRAQELLDAEPDADGVAAVLLDQAYGETEQSICRVAEREGEYFTQASVVMCGRPDGRVDAVALWGGNPREKKARVWHNVFAGGGWSRRGFGMEELSRVL